MLCLTRLAAAATLALLLAACASTPPTHHNVDASVDFSTFRTFDYFDRLATDEAEYQSLISNFLMVAVSQEMDKRGFLHTEQNPDLRINFYIHTKDKIKTRTVPTGGAYYGWRDPFYDPWVGYGGYQTRVDQYQEGTLNIDVVDASTNKLVWEGSITGRITDKTLRNLEENIDEAVALIMANFPVTAGGSQ